ncbi:MAG TPA: YihY/virulence factor BrkB family protein [Kineosporiaceae bacterium]|nr:YihY/virulence factor BrkB family protein [Kineosporiaceae bacterium]
MSTATHVPETSRFGREELSADDARATARRIGAKRLLVDSWRRMRYGDGFSSTRAVAFQFVLALVPLLIAFIGLASTVRAEKLAKALQETVLSILPGSRDDAFKQALTKGLSSAGSGGRVALVVGLLVALVAITTAMAQIERGANRIYGIQRDRPSKERYGRAATLALTAGIPAMIGFIILVAGGALVDSLRQAYGWSDTTATTLTWLRWPIGALLGLVAVTAMFRWAPRRRQPGFSWLAIGAVVAFALWVLFSWALQFYVTHSQSFGTVYGPLTGMFALLIWSQLTSLALLFGIAFAAQLEAVRAGVPSPVALDPERAPGARTDPVVVLTPEAASH